MAGSKKKFDLKKIIEIETIIAAILIAVASWGIAKWYDFDTSVTKTRQEVFQQYSVTQDLLLDNLNTCMSGKKISKKDMALRVENKHKLVQMTISRARDIPPEAFFSLSTFTRWDNSRATQSLCALKKAELMKIKTYIYKLEIQLWQNLKLRPS